MNKQVQAIRTEIERRMKEYDAIIAKRATSMRAERSAWKWAECKSLLSFLDTLQEQPELEVDLEKEIDKTVNECTDEYNFDWDKFARHFYELGKNAK